jgi:hypothetical protein
MLEMSSHPLGISLMRPNLPEADGTAFYATWGQTQGLVQRNRLPAFRDSQFAMNVAEIVHEDEYAPPQPARKSYSTCLIQTDPLPKHGQWVSLNCGGQSQLPTIGSERKSTAPASHRLADEVPKGIWEPWSFRIALRSKPVDAATSLHPFINVGFAR